MLTSKNKNRAIKMSMGIQFGVKETCMSFVVQYIRYTVSKWKTMNDCDKWVTKYFHIFRLFANMLYARSGLYDTDVKCSWEISKSTIALDEEYTHHNIFDGPRGPRFVAGE